MTDQRSDTNPDGSPDDDECNDIERAVDDRNNPDDSAEPHDAPDALTDPGMPDGVGGTGGVVKNQDDDAQ